MSSLYVERCYGNLLVRDVGFTEPPFFMMVRILYFAKASELSGTHAEELSVPDDTGTLAELISHVVSRHPALAPAVPQMRVARNEEFADLGDRPSNGDVIALIPPVAGG